MIRIALAALAALSLFSSPSEARRAPGGEVTQFCGDRVCGWFPSDFRPQARAAKRKSGVSRETFRRVHRKVVRTPVNLAVGEFSRGRGMVVAKSGVRARVAPSASKALQCVVSYIEVRGVRIVSMRGYGAGTVPGSLHPSGRALDINQTGRGRFDGTPYIPRRVSNAAADRCGVISGARWADNDNGHWNLRVSVSRRHSHDRLASVR